MTSKYLNTAKLYAVENSPNASITKKTKKKQENDNKLSMQLKNILKNYNKSKESQRELRIKVDDPAPTLFDTSVYTHNLNKLCIAVSLLLSNKTKELLIHTTTWMHHSI